MSIKPSTAETYRRRLARFQRRQTFASDRLTRLDRISDAYSWLRVGVVVGGGVLIFPVFWLHFYAVFGWFVLVGLFFGGVVMLHRRVLEAIRQLTIWRQLQQTHAARLRLDWDALPPSSFRPDTAHPFDNDLDMSGPRSLHCLLDTTTSQQASAQLRGWLLSTAPDIAAARQRQTIIRELGARPRWRDRLTLAATPTVQHLSKKRDLSLLTSWLAARPALDGIDRALAVSGGLWVVTVLLLGLNLLAGLLPLWQVSFVLYLGANLWHPAVRNLFRQGLALRSLLQPVEAALGFIETASLDGTPALAAHCRPLREGAARPSRLLKQLNRLLGAAGIQQNGLVWLLVNALLPWDLLVARAMARMQAQLRVHLPEWLRCWQELEALCALAQLADHQPGTSFPTLHDNSAHRPLLDAQGLTHPLLNAATRIANDFRLDAPGDIALLTGSNMSGKSTFLRAVGLNVALAYAGGPVIAERLAVAPVRLFACIRVADSVTDGLSYFYAEVKRLRALLDVLRADAPEPVLYLIDEIFRGTNNRERLQGSRAYIEALVGAHGTGIIATHDLELVQLAERFTQVRNYHFRDAVRDGQMIFDYQLRTGPCPTTNALKIMAQEGLPVAELE